MNPAETAAILRQFNEWRRDFYDKIEQPTQRELGEAIDAAVEMIERIEAAESDALEQARLNGIGAERELALMAKLEAAEKAVNEAYQRGYETGQEEIEKERDDVAQQLVQSEIGKREISEAHDAVTGRLRDLADENTALRAKIEVTDEVVRELEKKLSTGMWRALREENEALRAKIAEMEKQKPVGEIQRANSTGNYNNSVVWVPMVVGSKLYALPGAKGESE